jgi:glutamate dehydrogenase
MMTGGPDGDLGANQIQSFRGRICLLIDGGSVLFDPDGLDRKELVKIALARHTSPRLNSMAYPLERLGARGFRVPRATGAFALPDGTRVDDGAFFHRGFLADPANRRFIEQAGIQAFVPCGGFKDTINGGNARAFLGLCRELRVIVEGANVFFDDAAREIIARESGILQVKDSSANKGGVTCSSIAEVLAAFLLGEDYEKAMVQDAAFRAEMIRAVFDLISANAVAETWMLLELHRREGAPLCRLSVRTSEQLYALRDALRGHLDRILRCRDIVEGALRACVPGVLLDRLGMARTRRILDRPELQAYRDALLTKKLAALAVYRHAAEWDDFMRRIEHDLEQSLRSLVTEG